MSSNRQEGHSAKEASEVAKGSLGSRASTISSDRVQVVPGKETRSVIFSRNSRKCSEAEVPRGGHRGDRSNMPRART